MDAARQMGELPGRGRLALLGVQMWVVTLLIPLWRAESSTLSAWLSTVAPLGVLATGLVLAPRRRNAAVWLLGAAYTVSMATMVAALPELRRLESWPVAQVLTTAVAWTAFAAGWSQTIASAPDTRAATHAPLSAGRAMPPAPPNRGGIAVLIVATVGATAIAVVAPWAGRSSDLHANWGDASREGLSFTAAVATTLAVALIGLAVGPSLRARRTAVAATVWGRVVRVAILLALVLASSVAYFLIARAG